MKLIFFDEAKNDGAYNHYHIGGVCVDEQDLGEVERRIQSLAEECFGRSDLVRGTEFHAAEIFHRKNHFKDWKDFDRRVHLLIQFMEILSLEQVMLIDIQINCGNLHESQRPEEIAFMFLCERANDLARSRESLGMLIGDRESDRVSERYATSLSEYRGKAQISCLVVTYTISWIPSTSPILI